MKRSIVCSGTLQASAKRSTPAFSSRRKYRPHSQPSVCETEGWECGRYFRLDEKAGVLRFAEAWSVPEQTMDRFIENSREASYALGSGLIGGVWQSGQPLWIADIAKDDRVRKGIAREIGMHGAFF